MPLLCDALAPQTIAALNRAIVRLPADHALRLECNKGDVTVTKQGDLLLFRGPYGFYFEHMTLPHDVETELSRIVRSPRIYHSTAFEIDHDDPAVVTKLLDRFQEQYGKLARQIDWCTIRADGKDLMLVKFPPTVLRCMLGPTGGMMKTHYAGPADALRALPTLDRLGVLKDEFVVDGHIKSALVTEYKDYHYVAVQRLHWDLVREAIARPHSGITLGPIAFWDGHIA